MILEHKDDLWLFKGYFISNFIVWTISPRLFNSQDYTIRHYTSLNTGSNVMGHKVLYVNHVIFIVLDVEKL
jgi:hypothetical protein